jgi:hypothetical protein
MSRALNNIDQFWDDLRDEMRCSNAYLLWDLGKMETGHIPCLMKRCSRDATPPPRSQIGKIGL